MLIHPRKACPFSLHNGLACMDQGVAHAPALPLNQAGSFTLDCSLFHRLPNPGGHNRRRICLRAASAQPRVHPVLPVQGLMISAFGSCECQERGCAPFLLSVAGRKITKRWAKVLLGSDPDRRQRCSPSPRPRASGKDWPG